MGTVATTNISIRMDTELKKQAESMFAEMGLNMTTAMNIFLRQVVRQGKIPFEIATDIHNAEMLETMKEMNDTIHDSIPAEKFTDPKELREGLDS